MLWSLKSPLYVRNLTDEERTGLEAGLRNHVAFTLRRSQILCASAQGQRPSVSATTLHCAPQAVSPPTILDAIVRLGVLWKRAKHWMVSPDPVYARKKTAGAA
jgi:hypothetical protein